MRIVLSLKDSPFRTEKHGNNCQGVRQVTQSVMAGEKATLANR